MKQGKTPPNFRTAFQLIYAGSVTLGPHCKAI